MLKVIKTANLLDNLTKNGDILDSIEKSLEEYLELKRMHFPRFYFLSNDELIEIIAKASNMEAI